MNRLALLPKRYCTIPSSSQPDLSAACEKAPSSTPFKWNTGTRTSIIGLNSVKLDKDTVIASYTLLADGVFCDYDPVKKKGDIGSSFLERD